jgi:hypothetical protein
MLSDNEKRDRGLVKFNELSEKAQKEAYERFAWDFVNNCWSNRTKEENMLLIEKHWFTLNGGLFCGTN